MSSLSDRAIAVLTSDWHLSHEPPRSRADDWYTVMNGHVTEVMVTAKHLGNVPVFVAGDVFHTWNEPAGLITEVAEWLSNYSEVPVLFVAGQHDLPYHDMQQYRRSALCNLTLAASSTEFRGPRDGIVDYIPESGYIFDDSGWVAYGGGWGDLSWTDAPPTDKSLLVAHKYIHAGGTLLGGTSYPGATPKDSVVTAEFRAGVGNFSVALFGDNHIPFMLTQTCVTDRPPVTIYNHGCLIRRSKAERSITPELGILYADGHIVRRPILVADDDRWHDGDEDDTPPATVDMSAFTDSVKAMTKDESIDFRAACNRMLGTAGLSVAAKREILNLLDGK